MSGFEGPVLKGMNPFSNNRPRLTASERIRNKRDATIYQAEKERFQSKKTCGNKNVKYYDNGTIRSMKSYKLQKSLARGNVLCEDCDDKGLLCKAPADKDELATIQMGNNKVSEFWGGGRIASVDILTLGGGQEGGFPVIQSDVSGVWGPGTTAVGYGPKTDLSNAVLPGTDPSLNMPFGYIPNLIKMPRNLDGSGIVIDPSNILFPDELCDPFRYLQHSNLKTYVTVSAIIPIHRVPGTFYPAARYMPGKCNDPAISWLINKVVVLGPGGYGPVVGWLSGTIKSVCCKRNIPDFRFIYGSVLDIRGEFGLFDINIEVFYLNYAKLKSLINHNPPIYPPEAASLPWPAGYGDGWDWGSFFAFGFWIGETAWDCIITSQHVESITMTQGTLAPSFNQSKYNATQQSYMSCLENGTRKINFTKNTGKRDNVITGYCAPCSPSIPQYTITTTGAVAVDTTSSPGYTIYTFDTSGNVASLIIDISNAFYCEGKVALDYFVVGGGGGGGGSLFPAVAGIFATGGGGGGEVLFGTTYVSDVPGPTSFNILAGNGGNGAQASIDYPGGEGQDGSGSYFDSIAFAHGGKGAPSYIIDPTFNQGISNGGASGNGNAGGNSVKVDDPDPPFIVRPVAGGGGGGADGIGGNGSANSGFAVGDASGGIGGIGIVSNISGTSTDYSVGGGGGAMPYKFDTTGAGTWIDTSGIGGSSCGNALDPSGGHGGPSSIASHNQDFETFPGRNASCYGSGGGGGATSGSAISPASVTGGNGKRGIVIIKIKNST